MKKLFLFMAVTTLAISLNSCSSSSGGSSIGGTIVMKVNGTTKNYNTVTVSEEVMQAGTPDEYTELTIIGGIGTSSTEFIIIRLGKEDLGADAIYECLYVKDKMQYEVNVTSNVTTNNSSKKLIGNFSGTANDGATSFTFTEGSFNIQY